MVERIFAHFKDSSAPSTGAYDPTDPESYHHYLKAMMSDAKDYEDSILAVDRSSAQLYYYGYEPWIGEGPQDPYIGEDPNATLGEILNKDNDNLPNRSSYVSTDVRDAVMMMLPSLVRLFGASESPVYLVPRNEIESDTAEQATDYVNYIFWNDNPGFLTLYGAFKDALTVKTGFVKWWTDDHFEKRRKTFLNIGADQLRLVLAEDPSAKILDIGKPVAQPNTQAPLPAQPQPPIPPPSSTAGGAAPGISPPAAAPGGSGTPGGSPGPPLPPQPVPGPPAPAGGPPGPAPGGPPGAPPMPSGPMAGQPPPALPQSLTQPPAPIYDHVTVEFEVPKPLIKVAGVPPEEMRLDRYARSFKESRIIGHERIVPVDQLIAMGYDRELCLDNIQTSESTFTAEPQLRNPGRFMGTRIGDGCKYGEWYVKLDKDGDGVPELRYVCTIGEDREVVVDEYANRVRFALFSCDPISHTIVGDSLADYTEDIQKIKTNMARAILDSAAESINPKTVVNELNVTVDDALNDDLGAVIRTRGDVNNAVMFTSTPFLGQQALPVLQYLDEVLQRRTGLSDAAKGLDPKALQSSTMIGVEAVINGAQERIELVARVLCETGFKDLFSGLYNEICDAPNQKRTLKIRGKFVPYDTSTFDSSMAVEVNANLGKGSDMVRMLALQQIKQDQQMVFTTFGPQNPVVGIPEMINTISDMLALANIKNVGRYFKTPTPQQIQAIVSQPPQPNPMLIAAQAQMEKVRADTAKAVGQQQLERDKMQREDMFKHQQLQTNTIVDMKKLDIEGHKFGLDHAVKLGQLGSQLMKDSSASDAQDQQSQLDQAQAQNDADSQAQQQQADQQNAMMKLASQHMQGMAKIASQHTQAMTQLASQHAQGEAQHALGLGKLGSSHALGAAKIIAGGLASDADRASADQNAVADRESSERLAKQRPKSQ